jgi:hypothetical protein
MDFAILVATWEEWKIQLSSGAMVVEILVFLRSWWLRDMAVYDWCEVVSGVMVGNGFLDEPIG